MKEKPYGSEGCYKVMTEFQASEKTSGRGKGRPNVLPRREVALGRIQEAGGTTGKGSWEYGPKEKNHEDIS